jgi:hypothetical protein
MPVAHRGGPWEAVRTLDRLAIRIRRETHGRWRMAPQKFFTTGSKNTHRNGPRIAPPHIFHVAFRTFVGI